MRHIGSIEGEFAMSINGDNGVSGFDGFLPTDGSNAVSDGFETALETSSVASGADSVALGDTDENLADISAQANKYMVYAAG